MIDIAHHDVEICVLRMVDRTPLLKLEPLPEIDYVACLDSNYFRPFKLFLQDF